MCYTVICIASLFTAGAFFDNYRGNAPQEVPYGKDCPRAGLNRRTDTLVWGKNAVTELLKSGGAVDTVYLADSLPQPVAGYYTALAKQTGAVVKRVPGHKLQKDLRHR